ncbi:MAG: sulfotransferase [Pirellulaceae bacterium]|nr:sulfotransferase [Pirellulaceae bacterium]
MNSDSTKRPQYPTWAPRFWHGMLFGDWIKLLSTHRFRVHPLRWGLAATVTGATFFNSTMRLASQAIYARRALETPIPQDPVFILGHWRSGTTYLHELMSCDSRFATPTTYQCFAANHFLMTEKWVPRLLWFLMPSKRPMDNVSVGWNAPQEDEFALCSMGIPSPYLRMAFPNEEDRYLNYLDLKSLDANELMEWQQAMQAFLQGLTFDSGKRLILKSPTHTARVGLLSQMFPRAKFLHIVRDPLAIYPSTLKLWKVLDHVQGFQIPKHRKLEPYVIEAFQRMYQAFEQQRNQLADDQIFDIRYEELVENPSQILSQAYDHLNLGDFSTVRKRLEEFAGGKREYRTNQYQLSAETQNEILDKWGCYATKYGYVNQNH